MEEEMQPRPYQSHIERQCMAQNTIIFLPTGSGKTFIAVQIIKRHQKDIHAAYSRGGKRTFFLVNSVVLVAQQVKVLQNLTSLSVHGYSSQDKVDLWCLADWQKELERVQVMVMTSQILVDMLNHNFVPLERINLLVFDECHHGVDDHPMRQIMKAFEKVPRRLHPKIIGLTATLLNKNIKPERVQEEIRELEKTYNAMICSTNLEHAAQVILFSTNPKEFIIPYKLPVPLGVEEVTRAGLRRLSAVVAIMILEPPSPSSRLHNAVKMKAKPDKIKKFIKSCTESVVQYFDVFGVYGASLALLAYTVSSERLKLHVDTAARQAALQLAVTAFTRARAVLERAMVGHHGIGRIERFSSPRVRHVLNILKEYSPLYMASDAVPKYNTHKESLSAMVFVQERFACKVLGTILKHAAASCPELEYLKADFAVGFNIDPYSDTREGLYEKKQNKEVVMKYASGQLNCLVCTQVMEEGMDVPRCTLVLRFDPVLNYRSYIQAKGRGRHKKAVYAMLVAETALPKFNASYLDFQKIENLLTEVLVNDEDGRTVPSTAELKEKFRKLCPPYVCGNASVTLETAMSLVHRYCNSLPQDKFTCLQPEWFQMQMAKEDGSQMLPVYQVSVLLPPFCPIKGPIKGVALLGLKNAKKAAALKACELLHKAGELTDKLLPRDRFNEVLDPKIEAMFFSHWKPQPKDGESTLGTKRNKRVYNKKLPACLGGAASAGLRTFYLHGICMQPVREDPTSEALYALLEQNAGLLVLTQSPLPELPSFRLYLSSGEIMVQLMVNQKTITLTEDQLDDIKAFHCLLFSDVLGMTKSFMCWDGGAGPSSYLVAASQGCGPSLSVDWEAVWRHTSVEPCTEPEVDTRKATCTDADYYKTSVVEPWYRSGQQTRYIVVKVCEHMTPYSPFCDPAIESFAAYYKIKYKLSVLGPADQPLLQVRYLSRKMNALLPRAITLKGGKSTASSSTRYKRHQDGEGAPSDEHLVPEFCIRYAFPGLLWLKGTLLPAVLHRMTMLLQCDELRRSIAEESGLGLATLPPGERWEELHCDAHAVQQSQKEKSGAPKERHPSPPEEPMEVEGELPMALPISALREDNYRLELKKLQMEYPWEQNLEPVDIERNFDTVTVADIECYENFVQQQVLPVDNTPSVQPPPSPRDQTKAARAICAPPYKYNDSISLLSIRAPSTLGPQLRRILEALTAAKSNDTVNLERLETLGDSFLKFSVSLVLLHTFPNYHEGQLTNLKGRVVSNKNLYFCGLGKDLPGRMKVDNFAPKADGCVPSFSVPKALKNLLIDAEVCPSMLYSLSLSRQEVLSGKLCAGSWLQVTEAIKAWAEQGEEAGPQRFVEGMDSFLGRQAVMDKTVADSVEALIGVYLLDGGTTASMRLLQWLGVLPPGDHWLDLLTLKPASPLDSGATTADQVAFLLDHTGPQIEKIVGYNFKDPCLLLQAMSHSSNLRNRVTDSYQRLEFLGDAVLDFLVTCHVYEHCGQLSPGELTDLRSALVNNNTLACLAVRLGLHKFLQTSSVGLDVAIAKFSQYQQQRDHVIDESILFLLQEDECNMAEYIEVPKVLGDLLESIAGAIFLDCDGDLATVWRIFYRIMHQEIAMFSEKVPKNPIRMLYENIHASPVFKPSESMGNGTMMVPLELRVAGRAMHVHGFGSNTAQARRAAAKVALRMLEVANC